MSDVKLDELQSIIRKRLIVPMIEDFSDANHSHYSAEQGGKLRLNLPVYANNSAALAGGLQVGDLYRTGDDPDQVCIVH